MDRDSFLSAVHELISSNYPEDKARGLKAAEVGLLIRRALPEMSWESLGYIRLKDILVDLEAQGRICTGFDEKHAFSVWLPGVPRRESQQSVDRAEPGQGRVRRQGFRALRKPVWSAFVTALPRGKRFIHSRDGTIRMGFSEAPDKSPDWVEIIPIDQNTQRAWAEQFLAQLGLPQDEALRRTLDSATWYRDLAEALREVNPWLVSQWNQHRSARVVEAVRSWAGPNNVSPELLFESRAPVSRSSNLGKKESSKNLREVLLAALRQMTVEELLEIKLPASCLLSVFRPDLVPHERSTTDAHE